MDLRLRRATLVALIGLLMLTATAQARMTRTPTSAVHPYGRAYVEKVTVTSSGGPVAVATGLFVKVRCAGSSASRCTFLFNLVAGSASGPAAARAVTVKPGTYTFSLPLSAAARKAVAHFGVLKAALTVYQQCGSETIVLAQRYPSI